MTEWSTRGTVRVLLEIYDISFTQLTTDNTLQYISHVFSLQQLQSKTIAQLSFINEYLSQNAIYLVGYKQPQPI